MFLTKRKIRFSEVNSIIMETKERHFELVPKEQGVRYRNIISSRDGYMDYPDWYFEEKEAAITQKDMDLISDIFEKMFQSRIPEKKMQILPPGAAPSAYMCISLKSKRVVYYTSMHVTERDFQVITEPVAEEFTQLVQLLMKYCSFPEFIHGNTPVKRSSELLKKTGADIESDKKNKYIGYRFEATGVFGYSFYKGNNHICTVSEIFVPSPPVIISGNGVKWRSDFEHCTIFPGLTRYIVDESDGRKVFGIVYKGAGQYEINESVLVYCDAENYTFYCNNKVIGKITRFSKSADGSQEPFDDRHDYKPYFDITADNEVNTELLMVIFSFPELCFGI